MHKRAEGRKVAAGEATARRWLSPRLGQEAVTQPPPPGSQGQLLYSDDFSGVHARHGAPNPLPDFFPLWKLNILLPVSEMGKLRQSPCPMGSRPDMWQVVPSPDSQRGN